MARKLILLIDHEPSVRAVLQVCLNYLGGWDVHAVSTLTQGLGVLDQLHPEAILLDAPALEFDEHTAVIALGQEIMPLGIPMLLITARAKWFSPQQLKAIGAVGALPKPFNPLTLPNQIRELLQWAEDEPE